MEKAAVLLREAKNLRSEGKIQFVWTKNGDVYVRRDENSRSVKIVEANQLHNVVNSRRAIHDSHEGNVHVESDPAATLIKESSKRTIDERSPEAA